MESTLQEHDLGTRDLLIRLDERTTTILQRMDNLVTQQEFQPVKQIAYSLVGFVLLAVLGAVMATVIIRKKNN